jgi:hypothetical protein
MEIMIKPHVVGNPFEILVCCIYVGRYTCLRVEQMSVRGPVRVLAYI